MLLLLPAICSAGTVRPRSWTVLTPCWSRDFWVAAEIDRATRLTVSDCFVAVTTTSDRTSTWPPAAAGA
jgi:hypothetical protein